MHCGNEISALPARQRGFTLLLMTLLLLVGGVSLYLSARSPGVVASVRALQQSAIELDQAVTALAVYSAADGDRPGALPCPDFDGDGTTDINCLSGANPLYVERLPWKTLDLARDASGLWYVMDSDFRDDNGAEPINVALDGSLVLDGEAGYAALVIDPGEPLAGQDGRGTAGEGIDDYLDVAENTDGDDEFVDCSANAGCNDRIVGLTVDQLFRVVQRRLVADLESLLREFHGDTGFLPYAAEFSGGSSCDINVLVGRVATTEGSCDPGGSPDDKSLTVDRFNDAGADWILANDWLDHVVYSVDSQCTEPNMNCPAASHTLEAAGGLASVLASSGSPLAGQDRTTSPGITDYLESSENTDGDTAFDDVLLAQDDNDVLRGFALP